VIAGPFLLLLFGLPLLGAPLPGEPTPSRPAFCARAEALAQTPPEAPGALAALEEALLLLPSTAAPVVGRARSLAGAEGSLASSFAVLRLAVEDGCAARAGDPAALAATADELMKGDPRFGGVREGDDFVDRLKHKLALFLARLFESEGMQQFSSSARVGFLVVLAVVAGVAAARVLVALRRDRAAAQTRTAAATEVTRRRAFSSWRQEAAAALAAGEARAALRAGQSALLARLGELDDESARRAVSPARTHREILARLDAAAAAIVAPPLRLFDACFFGKDASVDDAARFLAEVDAAERLIRARAETPPGAPRQAARAGSAS
jgi:hypothetical protein